MVDRGVAIGLGVLPLGAEPADIGVASGKIGAPGSLAAIGAGRTLDASGQIVIPGGIDANVHRRWPIVVPGTAQHQLTDGPARGLARRYDDKLDSAFSDVNGPDVLKLRLSLEHEPMMGCWSYGTQPVLVGEVEKYMGPQTHDSDNNQIDRNDVVEDSRYQQNQDAGNQCNQRLYSHNVDCHRADSPSGSMSGKHTLGTLSFTETEATAEEARKCRRF